MSCTSHRHRVCVCVCAPLCRAFTIQVHYGQLWCIKQCLLCHFAFTRLVPRKGVKEGQFGLHRARGRESDKRGKREETRRGRGKNVKQDGLREKYWNHREREIDCHVNWGNMFTFLHTARVYFLGNKCNSSADDIFINLHAKKSGYTDLLRALYFSILHSIPTVWVCASECERVREHMHVHGV